MIFENEHLQEVEVTGLGDISITSLTIDEAASDELFRVRGRTASISFLTSDRSLYSTILRGTAVTISVDGVTLFDGKVSSVPSLQPYNYTKETFTVYCDDYLTSLKYVPYTAPSLTIYDIFLTYLPTFIYQPANGIDITTTYIDLISLTDTTTTVADLLTELCKLLNVEIRDGFISSPVTAPSTLQALTSQRATCSLGKVEAVQSAEITIEEEETAAGDVVTPDEPTADEYTWGTLKKETYRVNRGYISGQLSPRIYAPTWKSRGLFPGVEYDSSGLPTQRADTDATVSKLYWLYMAQYYRTGTRVDTTYITGVAGKKVEEVQVATQNEWCDEQNQHVDDVQGMIPKGAPAFSIKTVVTTISFYVGATNLDYGIERGLAEIDVDLHNTETVYFTRSYALTLPPLTTYKPRSYLLINASFDLYPVAFETLISPDDDPRYPLTTSPALRYITKVAQDLDHPRMRLNIRVYDSSDTLVYERTPDSIRLDVESGALISAGEVVSGADIALTRVSTVKNVTWDIGVDGDGWAILLPSTVTDVARVEVDFCGIGGFVATIYNNSQEAYGGTLYTYGIACPAAAQAYGDVEKATQISVPQYSVDLSVQLAAGWLAEDPPAELDTTPTSEGGTERTSLFYWEQDAGLGSVSLVNKLNSLIVTPTSHTVRVGANYLGPVSSTVYSGTFLTEVLQLATLIDQRGSDRMVLQIEVYELHYFATFQSITYRLAGFSLNVVTGLYRCRYEQLMRATNITLQ